MKYLIIFCVHKYHLTQHFITVTHDTLRGEKPAKSWPLVILQRNMMINLFNIHVALNGRENVTEKNIVMVNSYPEDHFMCICGII